MAESRRPETEEERLDRVRRARTRKEIHQQRMRRKKLIRLTVYVLIGVLGLLMIFAVVAIVRKVQEDRAEQAVEEAIQEEITNSEFYDSSEVLHLSFPVLTMDSVGSGLSVSQFRLILEDLYANGYMLIDPYSLTDRNEKGFTSAQIMVPDGRKPMILSQYDVSYEEGDTAHATMLTKDASGRISCMYYDEYGSLITGAMDVVPIVEEFIESHPDFSYKGARGILGITGYRGLMGYQVRMDDTPVTTITIEEPEEDENDPDNMYGEEWPYDDGTGNDTGDLYADDTGYGYGSESEEPAEQDEQDGSGMDEIPAEDSGTEDAVQAEAEAKAAEEAVEKNRETVKDLVSTLRSGGWYIASNTFDVISYIGSIEQVQADAEQWNTVIGPIVGATDLMMLPKAADIGEWSGYTDTNPRYTMLRDLGFRYFFVGNEESRTWAQVKPAYVRQGMHEIAEYASYVSLMTESSNAAAAVETPVEDAAAPDELQTNGTLELVGEALQQEEAEETVGGNE